MKFEIYGNLNLNFKFRRRFCFVTDPSIQGVLREKQAGLKTLDDEITETCPIDEVERETMEAEELSGTIAECIDHISSVISEKTERSRLISSASRELNLIEVETVRTNTSSTTISGAPASVSDRARLPAMSRPPEPIIPPSAVTKPKLPKIELPKFSGDVTKFRSFWESFESSVHQNAGLSAIDKFNYLRALLDGAAARSIQRLALTEGNYGAAIDVLKERFGKPQHIIAGHMKDFMKIPSCTSDKPSQLRSIYDKIYANVRGLEALGIGAEQYGSFLIPIVMDRLPADVCLQIARVTTKDIWEIDELLQVLRTEVEAREISDRVKTTEIRNPLPPSQQRSSRSTASALVARESGSHSVSCAYCKENHYSASCGKVTGISDRRDILRKEGRCFVCLMKGRRASECQGTKRCRKCGRRHHQSLCEPPSVSRTEGQEAKECGDVPTTSNNVAKCKNSVLLQTARTRIFTADDQLIPVRILLDNGSQRSYITNALKIKVSAGQTRTT